MTAGRRTDAAVAAAVIATLAALLTGCGGTSAAAPRTTTAPADPAAAARQDETFAAEMVEHRHRALQLVGLAAPYAQDPEVLAWAGRVQTDYEGELRRLVELVASWGGTPPHVEGHTELGGSIDGVLDEAAFADLVALPPERFESRWLEVVITHLESAVPAARAELAGGADPAAKRFAQDVLDDVEAQRTAAAALRAG